MARLSNIPFVGSSIFDCDVDAATFRRVIKNAQADTAGVFDMVTGQNSPSVVLDRDGTAGHGCLLGMPIVNQWLGRSFSITSPTAAGNDGARGRIYLLAVPIVVPVGETDVVVHIVGDLYMTTLQPWAVLKSTSTFANTSDAAPLLSTGGDVRAGDSRGRGYSCTLTSATAGPQILVVEVDMSLIPDLGAGLTLDSWSVYFPRTVVERAIAPAVRDAVTSNTLPVTTPGATEALAFVDMDSTRFPTGSNVAIDGVMLTSLNRNQNALLEHMTGWPVGNQATYTLEDHDGAGVADDVAPARSRFWSLNNTLTASADVPQFALPIAAWAAGPVYVDDGINATEGIVVDTSGSPTPPVAGMISWFPPWTHNAARTVVGQAIVNVPDLPSAPSAATLKWIALFTSRETAELSAWIAHVSTDAFSTSDTAVPAVLSGNVIIASGTALGVLPDRARAFSVAISKPTGTKNPNSIHAQLCFVGVCFYYDP